MGSSLSLSGRIDLLGGSLKFESTAPVPIPSVSTSTSTSYVDEMKGIRSTHKMAQASVVTAADACVLDQEKTISACVLGSKVSSAIGAFSDKIPGQEKQYETFLAGASTPVISGARAATPPESLKSVLLNEKKETQTQNVQKYFESCAKNSFYSVLAVNRLTDVEDGLYSAMLSSIAKASENMEVTYV